MARARFADWGAKNCRDVVQALAGMAAAREHGGLQDAGQAVAGKGRAGRL